MLNGVELWEFNKQQEWKLLINEMKIKIKADII